MRPLGCHWERGLFHLQGRVGGGRESECGDSLLTEEQSKERQGLLSPPTSRRNRGDPQGTTPHQLPKSWKKKNKARKSFTGPKSMRSVPEL